MLILSAYIRLNDVVHCKMEKGGGEYDNTANLTTKESFPTLGENMTILDVSDEVGYKDDTPAGE